ncbi:MAG: FMN-binding protein [Nitrospiraceae bacterium]|nr:FMN-binding protein [Nitrospiraceae bacterium]
MSATAAHTVPHAHKPTSSLYMIVLLGAVSTVCGLIIVVADMVTAETIRNNLAQITREAVGEVLPGSTELVKYVADLEAGTITPLAEVTGGATNLFACFGTDESGQRRFLGCVSKAAGKGYAGTIEALYAYSPDAQTITGFKVLESKETPGLGDKIILDNDFNANFTNLDVALNGDMTALANPIVTVKHGKKTDPWQIDAISGATVSSKAVGALLDASAERMIPLIHQHLEELRKGGA